MTALVKLNPSVTVKLLLTFNPASKPHDLFMEDKLRSLRLMLVDNFPSLSDTQIRKINKVSDEVCSCSIHIANYNMAKIMRYMDKLTTDVHSLTMLRVLELTVIGENS